MLATLRSWVNYVYEFCTRENLEKGLIALAIVYDISAIGTAAADIHRGEDKTTSDLINLPLTACLLGLALTSQRWGDPEVRKVKQIATACLPGLGLAGTVSAALEEPQDGHHQPITSLILSGIGLCWAFAEFPAKKTSDEELKRGKRIERVAGRCAIFMMGAFVLYDAAEMIAHAAFPKQTRNFYLEDYLAEVPIELTLLALQGVINTWRKDHVSWARRGVAGFMLLSTTSAFVLGALSSASIVRETAPLIPIVFATICYDALTWPKRKTDKSQDYQSLPP